MTETLSYRPGLARVHTGILWRAYLPLVAYALIALPVALFNVDTLNHDAVSYVFLARHYLEGRWDLALSGTWSPVFVWLTAGCLALVGDMFVALRLAMAVSGLVFLAGCLDMLRRFPVPHWSGVVGVLCAIFAALFSGTLVTPDLLSAGVFLVAYGLLLDALARGAPGRSLASGALFGLAFLAKSVFLPIGFASVLMTGGFLGWLRRDIRRTAVCTGLALIALLLVAAPWVAALSAKYGQFTVTRASLPSFATIGPPDKNRDQPTNIKFYVPEPGRQSQFEDESILPLELWSPLDSGYYLRHYVRHIWKNLFAIPQQLRDFEFSGLGLIVLPFAFVWSLRRSWRSGRFKPDWTWFLIPILLNCGAYALNFGNQTRYYLIAVPALLLASCVGFAMAGRLVAGRTGRMVASAVAIALILFTFTRTAERQNALIGETSLPPTLKPIAAELKQAGFVGPVATIGVDRDKLQGIVLSVLLDTAYHGTEVITDVAEIEASCAQLLIAPRKSLQAMLLRAAPEKVQLVNDPAAAIGPASAQWGYDAFWVIDPTFANWRCRTSPPA